jgi:hypothetical protein
MKPQQSGFGGKKLKKPSTAAAARTESAARVYNSRALPSFFVL